MIGVKILIHPMRILFISRAYPPIVGGIENQNYALSVWLAKLTPTTTLANRRGKKFLPIFFVWATIRSLFLLHRHDVVLLGDGVLAPLGWFLKIFAPKEPVISILHGLDLTYQNRLYQKFWVRYFLPHLDGFIAVSETTKSLAVRAGLPRENTFVIPNGIDRDHHSRDDRKVLAHLLHADLTDRKILLSAGRLVPRKGVAWFLEYVFPTLPENVIYCIAGNGPDREKIIRLIETLNLSERVFVLGQVEEETLELLWGTADLFIQPNRPIVGDVEGFGIAVLEASRAGLPVIASRLEGLVEAITHGKNGFLVPPQNISLFREAILEHLDSKKTFGPAFAAYTSEHYSWETISARYVELLDEFVSSITKAH